MTSLRYVDVSDGTMLDTITLVDGTLTFETGVAREVIDSLRRRSPDSSDQGMFTGLIESGWSNGYAAIQRD